MRTGEKNDQAAASPPLPGRHAGRRTTPARSATRHLMWPSSLFSISFWMHQSPYSVRLHWVGSSVLQLPRKGEATHFNWGDWPDQVMVLTHFEYWCQNVFFFLVESCEGYFWWMVWCLYPQNFEIYLSTGGRGYIFFKECTVFRNINSMRVQRAAVHQNPHFYYETALSVAKIIAPSNIFQTFLTWKWQELDKKIC